MSMKHRRTTTFLRILRTAAQNFIRNAWLSIAAMAVMVITLSTVLFSLIASATFTNTIDTITDRIDISVYLVDSIDESTRQKLTDDLKAIDNIESVEYVSKDEALESYKKANQDDPELLAAISQTDNPLPASLRLKPVDVNKIDEIRTFLEQPDVAKLQSDKTSYSGDRKVAIDKIASATHFFQRVGFIGVIVFTIISMLIIFNTIQMAIFNRRDELTIMRLLGAGTWFIRGPFIAETVYYGIVSAVLAVTMLGALFSVAATALEASSLGILDIKFANQYYVANYWAILAGLIGLGVLIGATSSYIATHRYLKFKTSK